MVFYLLVTLFILLPVVTLFTKDKLHNFLVALFLCLALSLVFSAGLVGHVGNFSKVIDQINYQSTEIVSLRNGSKIKGSFILGSGQIKEKTYYFFYKKIGDGYKLGKVGTANTLIVEEENVTPKVKPFRYVRYNWYLLPFSFEGTKLRYRIVVPPDTVMKKFQVK